jgi:hypothetical protein
MAGCNANLLLKVGSSGLEMLAGHHQAKHLFGPNRQTAADSRIWTCFSQHMTLYSVLLHNDWDLFLLKRVFALAPTLDIS